MVERDRCVWSWTDAYLEIGRPYYLWNGVSGIFLFLGEIPSTLA